MRLLTVLRRNSRGAFPEKRCSQGPSYHRVGSFSTCWQGFIDMPCQQPHHRCVQGSSRDAGLLHDRFLPSTRKKSLRLCKSKPAHIPFLQIFSGLKSLTLANPLQSSLLKLAASGISVFSPHTSLDSIDGGINTWYRFRFIRFTELPLIVIALLRPGPRLASPFAANASSVKPIQPKFSSEAATPSHLCGHASAGMGRIVTLEEGKGMELSDVVAKVKELLGMKYST